MNQTTFSYDYNIIKQKYGIPSGDTNAEFLILKLTPYPNSRKCCCIDCNPHIWDSINKDIYPSGPVRHHSGVIVDGPDGKFLLEDHETGPEIIIALWEGIQFLATIAFIRKLIMQIKKYYLQNNISLNQYIQHLTSTTVTEKTCKDEEDLSNSIKEFLI